MADKKQTTKAKVKVKTKLKDKSESLTDELNRVAAQSEHHRSAEIAISSQKDTADSRVIESAAKTTEKVDSDSEIKKSNDVAFGALFDTWDKREFEPTDFMVDVPINSLESQVGYSSLFRQMHKAFLRIVAFYKSPGGGSLSTEEARASAFHVCENTDEAKELLQEMMCLPVEIIGFVDLMQLQEIAPRVAERLWEKTKSEARKEFESGHLAANINFPEGYMKDMWNIARYIGVRESFIDDWNPQGGIEVALIDMMAQCWFQWQYWIEQTVRRSETRERETHPDYVKWLAQRKREFKANGWTDGYWDRPYVSEQQAIEHAVQMADRFNRIFMRTLRQLRDLRRYAPVTINNPNQVNIATDGGQQVNVSNLKEEKEKKITS